MRNVMAMAGKELRAYFHSPIAYLVMTVYTVICGFVFYSSTAFFALQSLRMEMQGGMGAPPMSLNEYVIRPILGGVLTVVLLFLIPLITMRLYAEEKRSGTIELLLTSPLTDMEIILGKYLGSMILFAILEALTFLYFSDPLHVWESQCQATDRECAGNAALWRRADGVGHVVFHLHQEPDHCGRGGLGRFPAPLPSGLGECLFPKYRRAGDVLSRADNPF